MTYNTDAIHSSLIQKLSTIFNRSNQSGSLVPVLLILILSLEVLTVVFFSYYGFYVILLLLLIFLFLSTAFAVERSYYLFTAYFLIFPEKFYSIFFPGIPITFYWAIGYLLFLLLVFYWIAYILKNSVQFSFKATDKMLIVFFIAIAVALVSGVLRKHQFSFIRLEFIALSLYLAYFMVLYSPLKNNPKRFFDFITLCSAIIAFQFFDSLVKFGGSIFLVRVVSMHIHVSLLAISYICITLVYSMNKVRKIIMGLLLPFILVSVIISQQRALWGASLVICVLVLLIYIYHKRHKMKIILITIGGSIAFVFLSFFIINYLTTGSLYNTIISRGRVLLNIEATLSDASYIIRTNEIAEAMQSVKGDFLLGKGIGASTVTRWRLMNHATVDNSYAYIYWKMGILGLIGFVGFYIVFFVRGLKLLRLPISIDERIFTIATLLNFVGLFIVGLTNVCIVHYRFILIWAASIGFIEFIIRKYD